MPTITPFLWFDDQAEAAMKLYTSVFERSKVKDTMRGPEGRVVAVTFEIEGQTVMALNGGPHYKLSEAFSFFVACETQAEIDALWTKLLDGGGQESRCGWLRDRFGVSWQIIPAELGKLLSGGGDGARAGRVHAAMMTMQKLDLARLRAAYDGA